MDWKELEAAFFAESEKAIEKWFTKNPKQHAYVFGFHSSYRELDGQIGFPFLGVGSIEKLQRIQKTKDVKLSWWQEDWHQEDIIPKKSPYYDWEGTVTEEANRSTQAHWERVEKRFLGVMTRVAKALRKRFANHPNVTPDFVVYFDDNDLESIKKCVGAKLFKKHFSEYEQPSLAGLPEDEKLQQYLAEPWMHEEEIVALGEAAVEPLLEMLKNKENGWCGPSLLDDLGIRNDRIRNALREQARSVKNLGAAEQSMRILRYWGDLDFLFDLVKDKKTQKPAVRGLLAGLKAGASNRKEAIPLDYAPAEKLIRMRSAAIAKIVEDELAPGSSLIEIKATDIDEALRGLNSPNIVIRQHAVSILDNRRLGKKNAKRILPVLAERLYDEVPNIRRLTLLSIARWKAAGEPFHDAMKRLQKEDPDADVRFWARYVFDDIL